MSVAIDSAKSEKARIQGNASFKKGRWAEAIDHYTEAVLLNPTDPVALTNRAAAYLKLDKYKDAERDTTTALQLNPSNIKALYRRGLARKGLEQLDDALSDLERVLDVEPDNETALAEIEEIKALSSRLKREDGTAKQGRPMSLSPLPSTAIVEESGRPEDQTQTRPSVVTKLTTAPASPSSSSFMALRKSRQDRKTFADAGFQPEVTATPTSPRPLPPPSSAGIPSTPPPDRLQLPAPPSDPSSIAPGAGLHLLRHLNSLSSAAAWSYMQYYPALVIPIILSPLLEPDVLGQLFLALREGSKGTADDRTRVHDIMEGLKSTHRFRINMVMLSTSEKTAAQEAWESSGHGVWP